MLKQKYRPNPRFFLQDDVIYKEPPIFRRSNVCLTNNSFHHVCKYCIYVYLHRHSIISKSISSFMLITHALQEKNFAYFVGGFQKGFEFLTRWVF